MKSLGVVSKSRLTLVFICCILFSSVPSIGSAQPFRTPIRFYIQHVYYKSKVSGADEGQGRQAPIALVWQFAEF